MAVHASPYAPRQTRDRASALGHTAATTASWGPMGGTSGINRMHLTTDAAGTAFSKLIWLPDARVDTNHPSTRGGFFKHTRCVGGVATGFKSRCGLDARGSFRELTGISRRIVRLRLCRSRHAEQLLVIRAGAALCGRALLSMAARSRAQVSPRA